MIQPLKAKSRENLGRIMNRYYEGSHAEAAKGKFVIWIAIIVPTELLKGFDVIVCAPESHSAMCAARKMSADQCEKAEMEGYSIDLCSYARIDLGTVFDQGRGSPTMGLPKPDLLISDNDNCSLLTKWFDVYHRELGVPHFMLDVPFCYKPQQEKDLQYLLSQFQDLIALLEDLTGRKFDIDRVRAAVGETNEAMKHWVRFLGLAAHRPSGNTAFDTFAHMAPYFTWMRGDPEVTAHYRMLADEAEAELAAGKYPVPNEKYRLLWDNIAPWHQLRKMSDRLAEMDANIVYSTYASSVGRIEDRLDLYEWDGSDPLRYLARIQNRGWCCYGMDLRYKALSEMIERFSIDGLVFASNRSCKVYSVMQMDLKRRLSRELGVATVMIDVDHADVRKYSEENAFLRLEALLEQLDGGKAALEAV
ncbi:MAG: 2-hydroxyacyl-CoA dehydratase [Deltaproteobacteria bacterium]|nr:2-hydroxyacyl-CoA dehydratase [Deltaproteobacteria bacterium]MBW1818229.1 2-hydroxyacyl-CoA dehydratase [Deltaproteobacteria bacterium]MBW2283819.1 2-hydroxyacyl-CoA dehydratase [Deltaproteobacteria bacterium]